MSQLLSLSIRDFAIISRLEIPFDRGFSVFSGETGAGKSILFDALGLLLGARADSQVVRNGSERSELLAEFQVDDGSETQKLLEEFALTDPDSPEQLILRRQITNKGQSRAYINGMPVNLRQLKALAETLIDIHGQHAHQALMRSGQQRRLLDGYGQLESALKKTADCYRQYQNACDERDNLSEAGSDHEQRCELLRYQLEELDALGPDASDFEQLNQEYKRLSQVDDLLRHAQSANQLLYAADGSIYEQMDQALSQLQDAQNIDENFTEAAELVEQAQIQLKEAAHLSESLAEGLEQDPQQLQQISLRLDSYHELARKHRVAPEQLGQHWQDLSEELKRLESADARLAELKQEIAQLEASYLQLSADLSKQRQKAAKKLGAAITEAVRPLGLPHAICEVAVEHQPDSAFQSSGQDNVEIRMSSNPGQAPAALSKVASGGELARMSLAVQVVCIAQAPVPILLFDEVDVGIGGGIAEVVGRRLHELAAQHQVFCVTHQPQVAALADQHFAVQKEVKNQQTYTQVNALDMNQRVEEISRMLGGLKMTEQTQAHAREMLSWAESS